MMCNSIKANKEQCESLFRKHMVTEGYSYIESKGFWFWKRKLVRSIKGSNKIISAKYSYDDEDGVGFVTLETSTGKEICYEMRKNQTTPMFVEVGYFENIRYDILLSRSNSY